MSQNTAIRALSAVLVAIGLVLVVNPELVSDKPVPGDVFEAVERRIWWGLFIGFGVWLWWRPVLRPWLPTLAAASASLLFGLLLARLVGIGLDGSVTMQWVYVGIEGVLLAVALKWYSHVRPERDESAPG